jgi:PPK2 family polyphosphate:nucleotide phosphotransferase
VKKIATGDLVEPFVARPGKKISLSRDFDPAYKPGGISKADAGLLLEEAVKRLAKYQEMLYAQNTHALLVILQALDAAGKDSVIKHVMSGLNPQGTQVYSFKVPSEEELDHDYLWRCFIKLPERGRIGIFNRSYYEEVLVARVHPEIINRQKIPEKSKGPDIWKRRFEEMNQFERYLDNNGIHVVKIFLNVSKDEQRRRFLERIDKPEKNWKFSAGDVREREHWDDYMHAYEDAIRHTSTDCAPWYVVPADAKWFTRLVVSSIISARLKSLGLRYPEIDDAQRAELTKARVVLENESARTKRKSTVA